MARKTVANLKPAKEPVKLNRTSLAFIKQAQAREPQPGAERQWSEYIAAIIAQEGQATRLDAIDKIVTKEGGSHTAKHWGEFQVELRAYDHAWRLTLSKLDAYERTIEHMKRQTMALRDDISAIVLDSLSVIGRLDGLQLKLDLDPLSTQIGALLFPYTIDGGDVGTPAFCSDCE